MNLLAVMGSPRKGESTDLLVDKAIEGVVSIIPDIGINKINLIDFDIGYCLNCLACRDSDSKGEYAECAIHDDMDELYEYIRKSDKLIFGTPVHMGYATSIMMTFLERICWTFAKPEGKILTISQCPVPRSDKKRQAVIIISSGIIPPLYRRFCDDASPLIKQTLKDSLNAKTVGDMYAGDIEHREVTRYFDKAMKLGKKLASSS